jgi:ribosome-binding factor A
MCRRQSDRQRSEGAAPGRAGDQRQRRVAEELRHLLAQILRSGECRNPELRDANITVTEVRISPDLRNATVYVMPLAGANAGGIVSALRGAAPFLRGLVARHLALRYAPNLVFSLDETFDQADRISVLLARPEVARDLHPQPAEGEIKGDAC